MNAYKHVDHYNVRPIMFSVENYPLSQRIRFIVSNHEYYKEVDALAAIMESLKITSSQFNLDIEVWNHSVAWWENSSFLRSMAKLGVGVSDISIRIKERGGGQKVYTL